MVIKRGKIITIATKELYRIRLGIGKNLEIELEVKKLCILESNYTLFYKSRLYKNIRFFIDFIKS